MGRGKGVFEPPGKQMTKREENDRNNSKEYGGMGGHGIEEPEEKKEALSTGMRGMG